jgi:formylglycine-generating enzyme required for sulfatase activity
MKRLIVLAACGGAPVAAPAGPDIAKAPLSASANAQMISIPAGRYIAGSTPEERASAYDDFLHTANHDGAREHKWFDREEERHAEKLPGFAIDLMPVTQAAYAEFVASGAVHAPSIDEAAWKAQGFQQD